MTSPEEASGEQDSFTPWLLEDTEFSTHRELTPETSLEILTPDETSNEQLNEHRLGRQPSIAIAKSDDGVLCIICIFKVDVCELREGANGSVRLPSKDDRDSRRTYQYRLRHQILEFAG
jgi:hypothetical protein